MARLTVISRNYFNIFSETWRWSVTILKTSEPMNLTSVPGDDEDIYMCIYLFFFNWSVCIYWWDEEFAVVIVSPKYVVACRRGWLHGHLGWTHHIIALGWHPEIRTYREQQCCWPPSKVCSGILSMWQTVKCVWASCIHENKHIFYNMGSFLTSAFLLPHNSS